MEVLQTRLQQEASRREVFERKSAELERINDELRVENRRLIAEVDDLKSKLITAKAFQLDDESDDDEDDVEDDDNDDYENLDEIAAGPEKSSENNISKAARTNGEAANANLDSNTNNSNKNGTESGKSLMVPSGRTKKKSSTQPANMVFKVQTLKRQQKELKAELQHQSISYQEAFQKELDLRSKTEEKYESLRVRYDRLIEENDHMRTILTNHCINVPPHKPITGKRKIQNSDIKSLGHPPSFIPPGRSSKSFSNSSATSSPTHGSRKKALSIDTASKDKSLSVRSTDADSISQHSSDVAEVNSERTSVLSEEGVTGTTVPGELSRHSSSSSISSSGEDSLEHIVVASEVTGAPAVLSATHMNLGGASDRPIPRDIWTHVQVCLANPEETPQRSPRIRTRGNCSICTLL